MSKLLGMQISDWPLFSIRSSSQAEYKYHSKNILTRLCTTCGKYIYTYYYYLFKNVALLLQAMVLILDGNSLSSAHVQMTV